MALLQASARLLANGLGVQCQGNFTRYKQQNVVMSSDADAVSLMLYQLLAVNFVLPFAWHHDPQDFDQPGTSFF